MSHVSVASVTPTRNNAEWYQLLMSALVGTLLATPMGVMTIAGSSNDRLLLG